MKELFSRTVFSYILGLLAIVVLTGIILSYAVENAIMLVFILFFQYVVLMVMLYHLFDKYVKPVRKAVHTVDELLKGNYRHEFATQPMAVSVNSIKRSIA